jgi:ribonuclease HII
MPTALAQVPTLAFEEDIHTRLGLSYIAGLDEAGRGAIAGPVVAAAVILPLDQPGRLQALNQVNDSKQLTARQRERLFDQIVENVLAYGIGSVPAASIDKLGIIPATKQAMSTALGQLSPPPEYLLIDGRIRLRNTPLPQEAIIRGDSRCLSIAAASILAKVTRDRQLIEMDALYPQYGFAQHKGYCTQQHRRALSTAGPAPVHRFTFAPVCQKLL